MPALPEPPARAWPPGAGAGSRACRGAGRQRRTRRVPGICGGPRIARVHPPALYITATPYA